jgi:hypothetical protein
MAQRAIPFVESSHVRGVAYDDDTNELVVSFPDGSYSYAGVDPQVAQGFADAPSAGKYLNDMIKPRYPATKIAS